MATEREHSLVVRVNGDELAKMHALATAGDRPISNVVRAWIRREYAERFGEEAPPVPQLKHIGSKKPRARRR